MKKFITLSFLMLSALGCNNSYTPTNDDVENDSLRAVIDSIRMANSKNSNVGKHGHATIAEQAHQNIPAKKRFKSNLAKSRVGKRENYKKAEIARKKRLKNKK